MKTALGFYEDDEDPREVMRIFSTGPQGVTAPAPGGASVTCPHFSASGAVVTWSCGVCGPLAVWG